MFKKRKVVMLSTNEKAKSGEITFNNTSNELFIIDKKTIRGWDNVPGVGYMGDHLRGQHLYILSDEEIKEGDWILTLEQDTMEKENKIFQVKKIDMTLRSYNILGADNVRYSLSYSRKIIASTDNLVVDVSTHGQSIVTPIYLPQPSQSFIEKYITEYNKGNKIEEVLVEYEKLALYGKALLPCSSHNNESNSDMSIYSDYLKVNSKDNTITIKKVKDSWTKDEIDSIKAHIDELTVKSFEGWTIDEKMGYLAACISIKEWIEQNL